MKHARYLLVPGRPAGGPRPRQTAHESSSRTARLAQPAGRVKRLIVHWLVASASRRAWAVSCKNYKGNSLRECDMDLRVAVVESMPFAENTYIAWHPGRT